MNHEDECNCPGCFAAERVNNIQDELIALAGVEAIYNSGKQDPRFRQIRDTIIALGEDILSNLANFQAQNEIGVPFVEGAPEFMALFPGLVRSREN